MDKVVLAVTDGSTAAQGALGWAAALCAATHNTLSVATAWQPEFSEMPGGTRRRSSLANRCCGPPCSGHFGPRKGALMGLPRRDRSRVHSVNPGCDNESARR